MRQPGATITAKWASGFSSKSYVICFAKFWQVGQVKFFLDMSSPECILYPVPAALLNAGCIFLYFVEFCFDWWGYICPKLKVVNFVFFLRGCLFYPPSIKAAQRRVNCCSGVLLRNRALSV